MQNQSKNPLNQFIARAIVLLPVSLPLFVIQCFRPIQMETMHAYKVSGDVCMPIENRGRSLIPILFLMMLTASCNESGVGVEEPEEEIIQDQELALISSSPTVDLGNSRWKEVAANDHCLELCPAASSDQWHHSISSTCSVLYVMGAIWSLRQVRVNEKTVDQNPRACSSSI